MDEHRPPETRPSQPHEASLRYVVDALGALGQAAELRAGGSADGSVTGICIDSRRVRPGDLYAAVPGATVHGARFVPQAAEAGAAAVLTDADGAPAAAEAGLPAIVVPSVRRVLGAVSALVYGEPATSMRMIGVTGTQGKTTTTRLLEGALTSSGVRSAVIGTVGTRIADRDVKTALTTPEAPDLHGLFAVMRERDVEVCAMEVSSHALVMGRVDGVVFDVAVFLNLGRDHLDFHKDVEDYYQAKASLFTAERARLGLAFVDDDHGRRLAAEAPIPMRTFALETDADWRAVDLVQRADGTDFTVVTPAGDRVSAGVPLPGDFNVVNALAAIAAAAEAGLAPHQVARGIAAGQGVPGRLEQIDEGQRFEVFVDYAHKPDAVEAVLRTLRPVTAGRLVVVLGAGGDRDRGKRPLMGGIAADLADLVIVTDDNPRSEDPAAIRTEILAGATGPAGVREIGGRRDAIEAALRDAAAGDVVVIAGKGHETGQDVAGVVHPFDDREVAREVLRALMQGGGS
ncbi:MAG: UDP-N-acetylmuramoyl-L-alanyl-D-glutamate--2,6-diaminopimelate ligase [Nocardioidaceae bacterium]|nr:UDP-N-acetylmuramoyl-L-alanyl-D-glutamate--2,6-diaminopimelate ligase [Nocardioidaceae bacterium]